MIAIYYPYYEAGAVWQELRYSLRSLEANFCEEEYEVWLVGDKPTWATNVRHIPHKRLNTNCEMVLYDAIGKLQLFVNTPDIPDRFIRMYDDIYFLQPVDLKKLEVMRYLYRGVDVLIGRHGISSGSGTWRKQLFRTIKFLLKRGYTDYMTETHCPELFYTDNMRWLLDKFDVRNLRLLTSTLYYNVFPFDKKFKDLKTERILFYGEENAFSCSSVSIPEKIKGKYYLNHNNHGLNTELRQFIEKRFPKKSRFEL